MTTRDRAGHPGGKDGGTKLLEIRRQAAKGPRITLIGESQFWKLVGSPRKRR